MCTPNNDAGGVYMGTGVSRWLNPAAFLSAKTRRRWRYNKVWMLPKKETEMGKGSKPRPLSVPRKEFENSYERIFGKRKPGPGVQSPKTEGKK